MLYKFFYPRFINIQVGDTVEWINKDKHHHILVFNKEIPPYEMKIGKIDTNSTLSKKFDHLVPRIDYGCSLHPEEGGTIFIHINRKSSFISSTIKDKNKGLSKYLKNSNDSKFTPHLLPNHLSLDSELITLERFIDPEIFANLSKPYFYEIHNKTITIVFWDLSGFSTLCNHLSEEPSSLIVFLNEYFVEAMKIIHKHGGVIDKFIGDGIMVYFGFDGDGDGDGDDDIIGVNSGIHDAINTALELKRSFNVIRMRWMEVWVEKLGHKHVKIDLKCGIHCGNLLFGLLDMGSRFQVTSIGSSVNLASRLEGVAEQDEIIISKQIRDRIKGHYIMEKKDLLHKIKSFENIRHVYRVIDKMTGKGTS